MLDASNPKRNVFPNMARGLVGRGRQSVQARSYTCCLRADISTSRWGSQHAITEPESAVASQADIFSFRFHVSMQQVDENFETLIVSHLKAIGAISLPNGASIAPSSSTTSDPGCPTPSSSSTRFSSIQELSTTPQFNLASAELLLSCFRPMLIHFP